MMFADATTMASLFRLRSPHAARPHPELRILILSLATMASGCGILGSDSANAGGTYDFANEFGYLETIVVRPDYSKSERFSVSGSVDILDLDGTLSGSGTCTRSNLAIIQPGGEEEEAEVTRPLTLSGKRVGSTIVDLRIAGCTFPRPMEGRIEGGRIVLMTDVDFPVSRGTTLISDRFGDPTRLVMRRIPGG